jgi:LAS seventeen-binding protein 5
VQGPIWYLGSRVLEDSWSGEGCGPLQGGLKIPSSMCSTNMAVKELPRRKQQVTQERSKVLRETERDPFEDAAEEEEEDDEPQQSTSAAPPRQQQRTPAQPNTTKSSSTGFFSSLSEPAPTKKWKKDKKGAKKKSKAFNLEEEKPKMRTVIAESSVASTNLLNALQFINREQEQVSENTAVVNQFETCKMLRRHVLRYVSALQIS